MSGIGNYLANATPASLLTALQRSASANGSGVDVSAYEGVGLVTLDATVISGTTPTLDVRLQESDVSGSGYTDIAGAAFTQVTTGVSFQSLRLDLGATKKYVRAVATLGGTTPAIAVGVQLVAQKKYLP